MSEEYTKNDVIDRPACVDVDGGTASECQSENIAPMGINPFPGNDPFVIKTPVVLVERNIRINVNGTVTLPSPALEIQKIKNNLKITQCLLLQSPVMNGDGEDMVLFIKGFVRKKIDFSTPGICRNDEGICGDVRHCTVDVPFSCTVTIPADDFSVAPEEVMGTTSTGFEFFKRQDLPREFAEKDKLMSADLSEFNQISTEFFNNLPYCKLISSQIIEYNELLNRRRVPGAPFEERAFRCFESKMVVTAVVKVLQDRQVDLNA